MANECLDTRPKNRMLWFFVIIAIILASYFSPNPDGLAFEGKMAIALMACAIITWCTDVIPILISCAFFVLLMPVLGIVKLQEVIGVFANPVFFFVLGMFCFALALQRVGLSERIALLISIKSNGDTHKLLLYLMMFACFASAFIADIPVIAMLAPVALLLIESNGCDPCGNFGKSLLMGLPLACLTGGIGTPMGGGMNVMTVQFLRDIAHTDINFVQWTCIGFPSAFIITFFAWVVLVKVFPSEIRVIPNLEAVKEKYHAMGPLTYKEKLYIVMLLANMVFWFTEPFHKIPIAVMAVLGGSVFFFPGIDLLDWEYARNKISWEVLFINGITFSLGMLICNSGAAAWLGDHLMGSFEGLATISLIVGVSLFAVAMHVIVPSSPALAAVFCPVVIAFAMKMGINPMLLAVPLGFSASASLLLPIDPVNLITYQYGYYTMFDWFKVGVFVVIAWVTVTSIFILTVGSLLGLI